MSLLYGAYLNYYASATGTADPITNLVAIQSTALINSFGYDAQILPDTSAPHMKLIINDHYTANIIEGCNALSIIILFISFILAFAQGFKKTFLFLLAGTSLIYAVNLVRICILAIALYKYPNQSDFLHGVVFPGIIYGMVFLLIGLLVLIRTFESQLFYDPLLLFFKTDHTINALPILDYSKLYLGLTFRFLLNTLVSLAILWFVFKNKKVLKFSVLLYVMFFIICVGFFTFFIVVYSDGPHQPLFYVRRFLIQPLMLFLLVPAFYFFGNAPSLKK
ncbi:hypothetical protein ULMA_02800 [Patiriisocius marinus]|uniref:Exosortase F system-associated protein n=2 Tax=Patiriisocius marinus TaxID=1397112 RepID=A0A5J4IVA2_9FLAO|nr:hypothetical protein ULMA_02800 [Patiriisocius marinus]